MRDEAVRQYNSNTSTVDMSTTPCTVLLCKAERAVATDSHRLFVPALHGFDARRVRRHALILPSTQCHNEAEVRDTSRVTKASTRNAQHGMREMHTHTITCPYLVAKHARGEDGEHHRSDGADAPQYHAEHIVRPALHRQQQHNKWSTDGQNGAADKGNICNSSNHIMPKISTHTVKNHRR